MPHIAMSQQQLRDEINSLRAQIRFGGELNTVRVSRVDQQITGPARRMNEDCHSAVRWQDGKSYGMAFELPAGTINHDQTTDHRASPCASFCNPTGKDCHK